MKKCVKSFISKNLKLISYRLHFLGDFCSQPSQK